MSAHEQLLSASITATEAELTPEERRVQRISWARGELMLRYPEMTWERATEIVTAAAASMAEP